MLKRSGTHRKHPRVDLTLGWYLDKPSAIQIYDACQEIATDIPGLQATPKSELIIPILPVFKMLQKDITDDLTGDSSLNHARISEIEDEINWQYSRNIAPEPIKLSSCYPQLSISETSNALMTTANSDTEYWVNSFRAIGLLQRVLNTRSIPQQDSKDLFGRQPGKLAIASILPNTTPNDFLDSPDYWLFINKGVEPHELLPAQVGITGLRIITSAVDCTDSAGFEANIPDDIPVPYLV